MTFSELPASSYRDQSDAAPVVSLVLTMSWLRLPGGGSVNKFSSKVDLKILNFN